MVTCVNQFFMLCSFIVFMPCFMEFLVIFFDGMHPLFFAQGWLQEPYLALDRIWALLHQRPEQANAATPEGKPMTLAVKKGTESAQRHTTKLWKSWSFLLSFWPKVLWFKFALLWWFMINPLEVQSFRWLQYILWENIDSRMKNTYRSDKQSMFFVDCIWKIFIQISSFNEFSGTLGPQVAVVQRSFYVGMAPCCCRVLLMPGFTMQQLQVKRLVGGRWHDILTGGV